MAAQKDVWLLLEGEGGRLGGHALALMHEGRRLKAALGGILHVILFGSAPERIAELAGAHGVSRLYHEPEAGPADTCPDARAALLAALISAESPRLVLALADAFGADLMPRVAARLRAPLVAGCAHISVDNGLTFTRPVQNGRLSAKVVCDTEATQLATLRHDALAMPEQRQTGPPAELHPLPPVPADASRRVRFLRRVKADHRTVDIRQAEFVIALGSGIGGRENLAIYEQLADRIGAALGGTRPVVDSGILPFDRQVGQTGKKIAPALVLLCGISGHDYFLAGIEEARVKIAVNTDSKAPVFGHADLGIVADVNALVPKLMEYMRSGRQSADETP